MGIIIKVIWFKVENMKIQKLPILFSLAVFSLGSGIILGNITSVEAQNWGGIDIAQYCRSNQSALTGGQSGWTSITASPERQSGQGAAYTWRCIFSKSGKTFTQKNLDLQTACIQQKGKKALIRAVAKNPNDAYSWVCESVLPR